jgi:hypothetical protein
MAARFTFPARSHCAARQRQRILRPSIERLESRLALSVTPSATNYITLEVNNNFDSLLLSKAAEYFGTTIDSSAVWLYANSGCGASTPLQYTRGTSYLYNWTTSSAVQLETSDGLIDQILLPAGDTAAARIYAFVGTSTAPTGDPGPQTEATPYAVFEYSTPNTGSTWGNWVVDISYVDQISIPMQLSFNGTPQAIWGSGATQSEDVQNAITDGFPTTQVAGPQSGYLPILTAAQQATQGAGGIAIPADVRQIFQGFSTSSWTSNATVEVSTPVTGSTNAYRRVASNQYVNWQPDTVVAADTQVFASSTPSYQSYLKHLYDNQPANGYYLDYSGNGGFSFYLKIEESQIPLTQSGTFTTYDLVIDTIQVGTGQGSTGKYVINTGAGSALGTNAGMRLVGNGTPAFYPTGGAQESVTSATANGTEITYYATNNFQQGQVVSISGMAPSGFNLGNQTIVHADSNSFTVNNALSAQSSTAGGMATSSAWFVMNWVDYMAGAIGLPSQALDGSQQWTGAPLSYTGTWGAGQAATYSSTIWYTVSNAIASGMLSNASYVAAVSPTPTNAGNGSSHMFNTWTLDQIRTGLYQGLLPGSDLPGIGRSYTDPYVNGLLAQTASGFYYSAASDRFAAMGSDVQVWSPSPTQGQPAAGNVGTVTWDLGIQNTWGITGPGTATAGMTFQAAVSAENGDVLTFTSSDPQAVLPPTGAFNPSSPQYAITLKTAGPQTVTVRDAAGHSGVLSVTVSPGQAAQLGFVGQPTFAYAKRFFTTPVSVQVQDAFGNSVAHGGDQVSLAFVAATGAQLLGQTRTNTNANGLATFVRTGPAGLRVSKPGNYALTATYTGTSLGLAPATSQAFSISRRAPITVSMPAVVRSGVSFQMTIRGADQYFQDTVTMRVKPAGDARVLVNGQFQALNGFRYGFTAADQGVKTFTVTIGGRGSVRTIAAISVTAPELSGSAAVKVTPASSRIRFANLARA